MNSINTPNIPNISSAEVNERFAMLNLGAAGVLWTIAAVNAELSLLNIKPDVTGPIGAVLGVFWFLLLHTACRADELARNQRAGIRTPG